MNDLQLNELCLRIRQNAERLPLLQRDQMELALFVALSDIDRAAKQAQYRLEEMRRETRQGR